MSTAFTGNKSSIQIVSSRDISLEEMGDVLSDFLKRTNVRKSLSGNEQIIYDKLSAGINQTGTETMRPRVKAEKTSEL